MVSRLHGMVNNNFMVYDPMNFQVFMGQMHESAMKFFIGYFMGSSYLGKLLMFVMSKVVPIYA